MSATVLCGVVVRCMEEGEQVEFQERLESLRSLAYGAPSPAAWGELCGHLHALGGKEVDMALDYVAPHVLKWPAELRKHRCAGMSLLDKPLPKHWPLVASYWMDCLGAEPIVRLGQSSVLSNIEHLHVCLEDGKESDLDEYSCAALAESSALSNLTRLYFPSHDTYYSMYHNGAMNLGKALANASFKGKLSHLDLRGQWGGDILKTKDVVHPLMKFLEEETGLSHLDFAWSGGEVSGLYEPGDRNAVPCSVGQRLSHLAVGGNVADEAWLARFFSSKLLSRLTHLDLSGLSGDPCSCPDGLPSLEGLCSALSQSSAFPNVKCLQLGHNCIGDEDVALMASSPHWSGVKSLDFASNYFAESSEPRDGIGVEGVAALMDSASCFSRLNELRLSANLLGDDGVEVLARSPHARHLSVLALDECGISDRGALALINSPYLSQDCALGLRDNPQISDKVAVQLQARFERCKLQRTHKPNSRCLYHVAERASSGVRMWETWRWDPLALVHSEWVEPRSEYWDVEDWLVPVRVD